MFCDVNNLFYFDETVCDLLYSNFIQNHVLFYNCVKFNWGFSRLQKLGMSVGKFTVNKILEASLNFNRKVMSWKSAIQQKKRYILSAVLLYCNMQSWSVGSGSCTVSTTGIVTVIFSHEKKN